MKRLESEIITARIYARECDDLQRFIAQVDDWCSTMGIKTEWQGHHSRTINDTTTYHYDVWIPDERHRLLFALRWA